MPRRLTRLWISKHFRDALHLQPGAAVEFAINAAGELVLHRARPMHMGSPRKNRFDAVCGRADVLWRTDELMKMLRAEG